jgi:Heterokaryon incompatibility protein (HET)
LSTPRQVICDNRTLSVTQSLYSALLHLRNSKEARTIWADAICINQRINAEKNHQVALMEKIYSQTERTLAWIGEEEDGIARNAFDYLDRLDTYLRTNLEEYDSTSLGLVNIDVPDSIHAELSTTWLPGIYTSLGALVACPWFNRLWVLQEVVLPQVVEVVFGTQVLALDKLISPIMVMGAFFLLIDQPSSFDIVAFNNIFLMGLIRRRYQQKSEYTHETISASILKVFRSTKSLSATDPRDMIYGLLGLGYAPGFIADYNLSIDEVFQNFALWCLGTGPGDLQVLSYAGLPRLNSTLPSWVPVYNPNNGFGNLFHEIKHFNASRSPSVNLSSPRTEKSWHLSSQSVLVVRGGFIDDADIIAQLGLSTDLKQALLALQEIFEIAKCTRKCLNDERYNKLCQAITVDLDYFGFKALPKQAKWAHQCFQMISKDSLVKEPESVEKDYNALSHVHQRFLSYSNFCLTSHDRFAWVPLYAEVGDKICIFQGATIPFVVRPQGDGKYTLVGECWVQGMMEGEALSLPRFRWQDISLI